MNTKRREALKQKYSFIKVDFQCSDGWLDLLEDMFDKIALIVARDGLKDFRFSQIKEKFGGLRAYNYDGNEEITKIVDDAEQKSYETCEHCGNPGTLDRSKSLILTLCDSCKERRTN